VRGRKGHVAEEALDAAGLLQVHGRGPPPKGWRGTSLHVLPGLVPQHSDYGSLAGCLRVAVGLG
jgi:hypothetical protein